MGMFDTSHKINYQRGFVDKDTILDLISQVEKFPDEEYGDYGEVLEHTDYCSYTEIADVVINADVVEAIPKADYETRLKADLKAILVELQLEIEEMSDTVVEGRTVTVTSWKGMQKKICNIIQQKINSLKEKER